MVNIDLTYDMREERIMLHAYTMTQLTKNCKRDMLHLPKLRLALLGDCATQHLATALKGYAYTQNLALHVLDADYNQILSQVMDADSEMYQFKPDFVLIYMCNGSCLNTSTYLYVSKHAGQSR